MQLTGIKTTGKMTDYTRIEERACVRVCVCVWPCTLKIIHNSQQSEYFCGACS